MTALDLLKTIRDRGASIRLDGDRLILKPGHMVKDLGDEIRDHKPAIIEELRREGSPYPDGRDLVKCWYCALLVDGVCQVGHKPDGWSLLRPCEDYTALAGGRGGND